jgi:two-component system chemotaxis response regulator CheY
MKSLIVEDDLPSSQIMGKMISKYGSFDAVVNGTEAIDRFRLAHESGSPYDLILMDIMMPETNGLLAVLAMREIEAHRKISLMNRVKVIMTTSLDDPRSVMKALYESDANSYLVKPIRLQKLEDELRMLKLIF